MIKRNNKKGFTIVELVIVIAVIAILAAVLIPTFSSIVKKANLSADQQAVRQMNTALAADGAVVPTDIFRLHEVLSELGMTSEDYRPLTKDTYFFWDADKNCVLHVDENNTVIAPEERAGETYVAGTSNWYSLSLAIGAAKPEGFDKEDAGVTVKTGAEMLYVIDAIADKKVNKNLTITVDGTVDMMGAAFAIPKIEKGETITFAGKNNAAIKNATAVDFAQGATSDEEGHDGSYGCALFPIVEGNISISDITIENMNVKNTNASGAAFLIGQLRGGATATISNVTIKDSTIIGHRSVGALVGDCSGTLNIKKGISLDNVNVMVVGGRSGMLIGISAGTINFEENGKNEITMKDCSYGIFDCAQTKGTVNGIQLGLDSAEGVLYSHLTDDPTNDNKVDQQCYVAKALAVKDAGEDRTASKTNKSYRVYEAANDIFTGHVTGWN